MKLKHAFTKLETIAIFGLILAFLGLFYFRFIYVRIQDELSQYNTVDLEASIASEQARAIQIQNMQGEIDRNIGDKTPEVTTFDSQKEELDLLNDILGDLTYTISWERPLATGNTVRRRLNISFKAMDYVEAQNIIYQIYKSPFRSLIRSLSITPGALIKTETEAHEGETEIMTTSQSDMTEENLSPGETLETDAFGNIVITQGQTAESLPGETGSMTSFETDAFGNILIGAAEPVTEAPTELSTEAVTEAPTGELRLKNIPSTLEYCEINVSMQITFFETLYGSTDPQSGLIIESAS